MDPLPWLLPDWNADLSESATRAEIPEAGGWLYRFRSGDGAYSTVFVPNLGIWADTIAASIAANGRDPVAVVLDLSRVSHAKQTRPGGTV